MKKILKKGRIRRSVRVRTKVAGTGIRPRLSVFRSNKYISAQIINDETGKTITAVSEKILKFDKNKKPNKTERAVLIGQAIARQALKHKIKTVVFDRNGYKYHGRVKALADSARKEGLIF